MRILSIILLGLFIAGCNPTADYQYRTEGAGLALDSELTNFNTDNLFSYFREMCLQAGFHTVNCTPQAVGNGSTAPTWKLLVETGYNDIDFRCDSYLSWIEAKRTEKLFVDRTSIALGSLLGGTLAVANAGQDALSYVALALGFATSVYDAYHSSLLLGLEGSTIKEIVDQRRMLHRESFRNRVYKNRPEAILSLRTYLTYCTPQSIISDVNTFSRDAVLGRPSGAAQAAQRLAQLVPTSESPAGPTTRRNLSALPSVKELFTGDGYDKFDVADFQKGLCLDRVDGIAGKETKSGVKFIEQFVTTFDTDGKINNDEWNSIQNEVYKKCKEPYKNIYEVIKFGKEDLYGKRLINRLVERGIFDKKLKDLGIDSALVRKEIKDKRIELNITEIYPGLDVSDQFTPMLTDRLRKLPDAKKEIDNNNKEGKKKANPAEENDDKQDDAKEDG